MINLEDLECKHCGRKVDITNYAGWVVDPNSDNPKDGICPECFEKFGAKAGSIQLSGESQDVIDQAAPMSGNFKPVKTLTEIEHFRTAGYFGDSWWELENDNLENLVYEYPLLKLTIKNRDYEELWIKLDRENGEVVAVTVSGDRPSKNQLLTVYQQYRLRKMGLFEVGAKNTDWRVELSAPERANENVARIMSHILQFGLFIQPHKNIGLTATIDK